MNGHGAASELLRLERRGGIATLTIDRPEARNSLTLPLVDALGATVRALSADPAMRVLVLRGAGGKAFSAGFDIGAIARTEEIAADGTVAVDRRLDAAFAAIEEAPFPVVAAIRGHCIGGGFELALACDLRIAGAEAQFRMPPAQLGWVYSVGNLARFVAALGASRTRHVFLVGEPFGAAQALSWGAVHEVHADAAFDARMETLTQRLAAAAPIALGGLKQGIAALARAQVADADLATHADWRRRAFASDDLLEGRAAFLARRPPRFRGA